MINIGVVFGRFQVLHLGHMEYLLEAKKKCKHLIIGISNPDIFLTKYDAECPHRSIQRENPFTYYERMKMIECAMSEYNINKDEFTIVPFPINFPDRIKYYIPDEAVILITIYDSWGRKRKKIIENLGYQTIVLWERNYASRITSGTEVRNKIIKGECWKNLVSNSVYNYLIETGLDIRLRTFDSKE